MRLTFKLIKNLLLPAILVAMIFGCRSSFLVTLAQDDAQPASADAPVLDAPVSDVPANQAPAPDTAGASPAPASQTPEPDTAAIPPADQPVMQNQEAEPAAGQVDEPASLLGASLTGALDQLTNDAADGTGSQAQPAQPISISHPVAKNLKIFPETLNGYTSGWKNPGAAFSQDVSENAHPADFDENNSANLKMDAGKAGKPQTITFAKFGVAQDAAVQAIQSVQLRVSLAVLGASNADGAQIEAEFQSGTNGDYSWVSLGSIMADKEISNFSNGGFFLFSLPVPKNLSDLENAKVRLNYISPAGGQGRIYLDALWLEVNYQTQEIVAQPSELNILPTGSMANATSTAEIISPENLPAAPPNEELKIFPTAMDSDPKNNSPDWKNPNAAFNLDLAQNSAADFNADNSATINLGVGDNAAGGPKAMTLTGFSVGPKNLNKTIDNLQLRVSLASVVDQSATSTAQIDVDYLPGASADSSWIPLGSIPVGGGNSNAANGGFFLFSLPIPKDLSESQNSKVRFSYTQRAASQGTVYLDAAWLEASFKAGENPKITPNKIDKIFKKWETPRLDFPQIADKRNFIIKAIQAVLNQKRQVSATLVDPVGNESADGITIQNNSVSISGAGRKFRPGRYALRIMVKEGGDESTDEQHFDWGVLTVNTDKSVYLGGDTAQIDVGVLNYHGHTICNAQVTLAITDPSGAVSNPPVQPSTDCGMDNVTDVPDYSAVYQVAGTGTYQLSVTAVGDSGTKEITDSFEVKDSVPFDVQRLGPTRINPTASYQMQLVVKANRDYHGEVTETVPVDFDISAGDDVANASSTVPVASGSGNVKTITWQVDWAAGETHELGYTFKAPDVSPYIFLLGPLAIGDFSELRQWQIASDGSCAAIKTGSWSNTATWSGCGTGHIPAAGDTVGISTDVVVTVDGNDACDYITIMPETTVSGQNGFTISGTNSLTLGYINSNPPSTTGANSIMTVAAGTLNVTGVGIYIYGSASNHPVTLGVTTGTVNDAGDLYFDNIYSKLTFTGSGGTVNVGGVLGASGTLTAASGTVGFNGSVAQTIPVYAYNNVTINNAAGAALAGTTTITGMLTMTSGTLNMANTSFTIGSLTGSGNLTHSSGTAGAKILTIGSDNTSPAAYTGVISTGTATSVALTKSGTGTLILSGSNSYAGLTTISAGTIKLGAAGGGTNTPLGTTAAGTTVSATGAALDLNGFTLGTAEALTLNGTGVSSGGALTNSSASTVSYSGLITLGSASSIIASSGTINITNAGSITGTFALTLGGAGNGSITSIIATTTGTLTKQDAGTWTLSGTNSYTGATTISGGTLKLGKAQTNLTAVTVNSSCYYDLASYSATIASLAGAGTVTSSAAGTPTLTAGDTTSTIFSGIIQNGSATSVALTKAGSGTLTLSGNSTYTGTTTISAGTIKLGAAGDATNTPLGTVAAGTMVSATNAVLDLNGFTLSTAEPLTLNGTGISSGGALMNSGSAATYSGLITLGSASSIIGGTGTINISNAGTITGATFGLTLGGAQGGTLASILGTTSGTLTKQDAGTWTLSGASTYTGLTTISAGTLKLGAAGDATNTPLGTTGAGTTVSATGAALDLNGFTLGTAEALTLNGTGVSSGGALMNSGSAATYSGLITLGSTGVVIDGGTGTINISNAGTITGSGYTLTLGGNAGGTLASILGTGAGTLTKADTGAWTLSGASTYTGATTISAGTLDLGVGSNVTTSGPFGTNAGGVTVSSGAVLDLNGFTIGATNAEALSLTGTGLTASPAGALTNTGGNASYLGTITIGSTGATITATSSGTLTTAAVTIATYALTINGAGNGTVSGVIGASTGTVTKNGTGTWTLSGANTYTGATTISAGTIKLGVGSNVTTSGPFGTNAGGVTVSSGAVLDLNGFTIGATNAEALSLTGTGLTASPAGALTNTGADASYLGTITTGATATITATSSGALTTAAVTIGANALTLAGAGNGTVSGVIGASTGTVTKNDGGTWTLSGLNTYTGATSISGGTLKFNANDTNATAVTVSANCYFDLVGHDITIASLAGAGTVTSSAAGSKTLTAGNASNTEFSGIIQDGSGTVALYKAGTGVLTLSGSSSTYTGLTTINAGTLKLGASSNVTTSGPFGTNAGGVTVTSGAVLDLNGYTIGATNAEALTLNGTGLTASPAGALTNNGVAASYLGTITLGSSGATITATASGTLTVAAVTGAYALTLSGAGNGTVSGVIGSGAGTVTVNASGGTWTLSGNNSYTGTTTISAGTLKLGAAGDGTNTPLGTVAGATSITANAVLDLNGFTLSTAEGLTSNGTGISSTGAVINSSSTGVIYSGNITIGASGTSIGTTGDITLGGIISAASTYALSKVGTGTLTLSGASTYTGLTTISAGTCKLGAAGNGTNTPFGTVAGGISITGGAVLDLNGFTLSTAEALTLNGSGISSGGALTNSSVTAVTYSGLIALGSASSIIASLGDINITNAGTISGSTYGLTLGGAGNGSIASIIGTGTGTLTKQDAGTWTLSGASTYTGATTISAGTLSINTVANSGSASAIGAGTTTPTILIGATGVLKYTGTGHSSSRAIALTGSGGTIDASGGGTLTLSGGITGSTYGLVLTGTGAGVESGVIGTTSGTVTKNGAGTWTLSASNTYTGLTTINVGTIMLGATGGGTNTPLGTVDSGTTVAATGAALDLAGYTLGTSEVLTLNGTGVSSGGALMNSGANVNYNGAITLASASSIGTTGNIVLGGGLTGGYDLTKVGAGSLSLGSSAAALGALIISAGTLVSTSDILTLTGDLSGAGTFTHNSGTVTFNGAGTESIGAFNYYNLTSSSSGSRTLASGTIGIAGTFTPGSNSYTVTGSTIQFNGSGSQTIPAFNYYNLTSSGSGARILASSGTIGVAGDFTPGTNSYTNTGSTINFNGSVSAWSYRKQITITGQSGAGTNYQVLFNVGESSGSSGADFNIGGHATSFPNDIKFTASDGATNLPFWVESTSGTTPNQTAKVWVKVSADLGSNQNIYIYYGKSGQASLSDGASTFVFYDDFEAGSLDTNKWLTNTRTGTTITQSGGMLTFSLTTATYSGGCVVSKTALPAGDYALLTEAMHTDNYTNGPVGTFAGFSNTNTTFDTTYYGNPNPRVLSRIYQYANGSNWLGVDGNTLGSFPGTTSITHNNMWFRMQTMYSYTTATQSLKGTWEQLASPFATQTLTETGSGELQPLYITLGNGDYNKTETTYFHYIAARKYQITEPAYNTAAAEEAAPAVQTIPVFGYNNLSTSTSGTKAFAGNSTIAANLSVGSGTVLNLSSYIGSTANQLYLGGTPQASGTWGSTGSSATHQNNTYFTAASTGYVTIATGNNAPTFNTGHEPHEDAVSDGTTPTNMGANVTFKATANDTEHDSYYLAICKTNEIHAGTSGGPPTCNSTGNTWAISTLTTYNNEASVSYTVTSSETAETYDWYAFACDNNSVSACSAMSNSGANGTTGGSPFNVDHAPSFSASQNDGGKDPGGTLTFKVLGANFTDGDSNGGQDTVKLYVCDSTGFTGGATPACTGTKLCNSTATTPGSDMTCTYNIDNPKAAASYDYYTYIVDNHGLIGSGAGYGEHKTYSVNNVLPVVSGTPTFNGSSAISLTAEKGTTDITVTETVSDDNGCGDLSASNTYANAWLTSLGGANCTDNTNYNKCYYHATCARTSGSPCSGKTDNFTCTVHFQYYVDPTDSGTPWAGDSWTATFIPGDSVGTRGTTADSGTRTMNSYLAMDLASGYSSIAYGSVEPGANMSTLAADTRPEATGNVAINTNVSGTTMTGPGTAIPIANQEYGTGASAPSWASGTALSGTPTLVSLGVCKSGYVSPSGTPANKDLWWGIAIPSAQTSGAYTGTNTITAVEKSWATSGDWCEQ